MDPQRLQAEQRLVVRQRLHMMLRQYEVYAAWPDGSERELLAFAQQKRMTFWEHVTLYADDTKQQPVLSFKEHPARDVRTTYDVMDATGMSIGVFRRDFARSLLRSTWHLMQPRLGTATGQERSLAVALLRRLPFLYWLPYHFDFVVAGQPAFSVVKTWGVWDRYVVDIPHPSLDRRLVIAMAVALDALQGR